MLCTSAAGPGSSGRALPCRLVSPIIREAVADAVRGVLYRALSAADGDVARAAITLGTSRTSMYNMMRRYGIKIARNKAQRKPVVSRF